MGLVVAGSPWGQPGGAKEPDLRKIPGVQGDGRQELEALHLPGAQESGPFQPPPHAGLDLGGGQWPCGSNSEVMLGEVRYLSWAAQGPCWSVFV